MESEKVIQVRTSGRDDMVDITGQVASLLPADFNGACLVCSLHTTAGITVNENADPDVPSDLLAQLDRMIPWNAPHYRHGEGNSAAHLKASLVGSSATVPVQEGRLNLGVWQAVFLCEFDGPRQRRVLVKLLAGGA